MTLRSPYRCPQVLQLRSRSSFGSEDSAGFNRPADPFHDADPRVKGAHKLLFSCLSDSKRLEAT